MTTHRFNARALYDIYRVEIAIRDRLCGGMPKSADLIEAWVKATTGYNDQQTKAQTDEARAVLLEEVTERSWNGFPADASGVFVWARQIKALFKECATMLRVTVDKRGSKQIFQHGFEIKSMTGGDRIHIGRPKADGYSEGPIHVQTPQGPRTALKRVDYVERPTLTFEVWVLSTAPAETRHVGQEDIETMLTFAQENGLGADRSQGMGKFDVVSFDVVQKVSRKATKEEPAAEPEKKPARRVKHPSLDDAPLPNPVLSSNVDATSPD